MTLKKIINENRNRIISVIKNITGNKNEDLEQEVYIKAWKSLKYYEEKNKFTQWISQIASNISKDYLKSKSYKVESLQSNDAELNNLAESSTPEKVLTQKERQKIILDAVYKLPPKLKQVVILYEFEDKSYEEISRKLKVPIGTIKSRLSSARKALSVELQTLKGE